MIHLVGDQLHIPYQPALFTLCRLLNPPVIKQSDWQIWIDREQIWIYWSEENYILKITILGASKVHFFVAWNGLRYEILQWPFTWGWMFSFGVFMEVFPHCSIFKGLLYARSIFNGRGSPLFVRQKDIGWVVKVSIIKISYSRDTFHHRNNCKACNKTYRWSKYCEDIVKINVDAFVGVHI